MEATLISTTGRGRRQIAEPIDGPPEPASSVSEVPVAGSSDAVDETALYAVVPDHFVAARAALVKRLRSEGSKADAARVAKLRRPPLTAWALNQLARTEHHLIDRLLEAGGHLQAAMEQALGGDASGLRQARAAERAAVDAIVAAAVQLLEGSGYSPTDVMQQRMAATLRAAIVDESVATLLGRGVLDGDRDAPGFGMDALSLPPAAEVAAAPGRKANGAEQRAQSDRAEPRDGTEQREQSDRAEPRDGAEQREQSERAEQSEQAERVKQAERAERRERALREAQRRAAEADALREEANHLVAEAETMAVRAQAALQRASQARQEADAAMQAALDEGAETPS